MSGQRCMRAMVNRCPVCLLPRSGGKRCGYHSSQRARGLSDEFVRQASIQTLERNQVIRLVCEAVDEARQTDEFKFKRKPVRRKKRKTLTIHAHWAKELCHAVDIGRATAGW